MLKDLFPFDAYWIDNSAKYKAYSSNFAMIINIF